MNNEKQTWLERPIHPALPNVTNEILIFAAIILLAFITRFYKLEPRVMSHDESLHTYFSWLLYRGQGYEHSPMMHGPLQFHLIALTYFLFGVNDFTSRIPAVLFSIATIWMVWHWRRYLGKWGALIAGLLLVISPYMLYYGRYVRNESYAGFSGLLMLYAILRHLEAGGKKYLYALAVALMIHFTAKETAFIYAAQALIYLAVYFIAKVTRHPWRGSESDYRAFIIALGIAILLIVGTVGYGLYIHKQGALSGTETAAPANPLATDAPSVAPETGSISPPDYLAVSGLIALVVAAFFLIRGYSWGRLRTERSFDLLMVVGTIVLPMLSPFLVELINRKGWANVTIPTTAPDINGLLGNQQGILIIGICLAAMIILSIIIGLIWNADTWWKIAALFWVPYIILFTTFFTNSAGFFTGIIGSLGYWLVQQGVERGSQPWYFYILVQIPIYEFLPALGLILAIVMGIRRKFSSSRAVEVTDTSDEPFVIEEETSVEPFVIEEETSVEPAKQEQPEEDTNFLNMFSLLVWWSIISVVAFSVAGEKMPWLTYHLTWPMILITGWALGRIVEGTDWEGLRERRVLLVLGVTAVFIISVTSAMLALLGNTPPFQGKELEHLQATSAFLLPAIVAATCGFVLTNLLRNWNSAHFRNVITLTVFAFLAVLTGRAAFRASYITYDQATEYLVYAHGATGIKEVIAQAQEISERTTGGMGIALSYDASAPDTGVSWPFVWYLRDFTNQRSFDQPTRSLRDSVVVIVDEKNFDKIEAALGPGYYRMDYIRMWWPMQDYFNLIGSHDPKVPFDDSYPCKGLLSFYRLFKSNDFSRFCNAIVDPNIREGIFQIWLNRDYTLYAQATGNANLTLPNWQPADQMRFYIRKDVAAQIWNYGVGPAKAEDVVDPTDGKTITLAADMMIGAFAPYPVSLNAPRSLAFAKDGTFYVADSRNHRILHLSVDGETLQEWGGFTDGVSAPPENGKFNEPWGVAVGADGSVYVTDTWNHRIQKFTATGRFIKAWGIYGTGETPESLYGPRGIAIGPNGNVFVADTGNKRIAVFDSNGTFVAQFGAAGLDVGQFDEPVGVAVDRNGKVYVTDTWNQRVQTFVASDDGLNYFPDKQWDVYGWFGQSLDNKPFIAVNDAGHVFITDPEGYRVMEFDSNGLLIRVWGDLGESTTGFGLASGIAIDGEGHIWVTDSVYNRIMRFTLP